MGAKQASGGAPRCVSFGGVMNGEVWGQVQANGGTAGPFPLVGGRPIGQEAPLTVKIVTATPQAGNQQKVYTTHTPTTGAGAYPVLSNTPLPSSSAVPPLNLSTPHGTSSPVCPPPPPLLTFSSSLPSSSRLYLILTPDKWVRWARPVGQHAFACRLERGMCLARCCA